MHQHQNTTEYPIRQYYVTSTAAIIWATTERPTLLLKSSVVQQTMALNA